jgi:predicted amino acid dehydrogenase
VILVARAQQRLRALASSLDAAVPTTVTTEMAAVRGADLVVLLTAAAGTVLTPEHLAAGAVVLDATQPRNTSPALIRDRPDVLVVDGGVVDIPSLRLDGADVGLPERRAYACFAETAMLALTGARGHFCLGTASLDQVERTRAMAMELAELGFGPSGPTCFGRPMDLVRPVGIAS